MSHAPNTPYKHNMWLQGSHCLWGAIVTGDNLLERVQKQVLPLGIRLYLRQNERQVILQVTSTDAPCKHTQSHDNHMMTTIHPPNAYDAAERTSSD